jgi:hypothetical protein
MSTGRGQDQSGDDAGGAMIWRRPPRLHLVAASFFAAFVFAAPASVAAVFAALEAFQLSQPG